jgi:hypothetical protein
MSAERKRAIARLLKGIEGLSVEQIDQLARKAELVGGWRTAMEKAAALAKTGKQERRPDTDEVTYQDLVAFCEEIGAVVEVASVTWNKLHGMRGGLSPSATSELRSTPVTVGKVRSSAAKVPHNPLSGLRQDEQLTVAWEKTL